MKGHLRTPYACIFRHVLVLLAAGWVLSACAYSINPVTGRRQAYGYTWAQECAIGKDADAEIIAQYGLYEDSALAAYVTEVGQAVLAHSHLRRPGAPEEFRSTPFVFRVLNTPIVNAFALPGGYIYVTRGLLAHLANEAQLAVVLGHEIGHVVARHASERALKARIGQIGLIGGAILAEEIFHARAEDVLDLGGTAMQFLFLKYSRDDERESDQLGIEYAAMAGYRAEEAAAFFRTLKRITRRYGAELPEFFSTHPDPGNRERAVVELAAGWRERGFAMEKVEQGRFYRAIEGIVLGEDPREGFVHEGLFVHPTMRFSFPIPPGWSVRNEPRQVRLAPERGEAMLVLRIARDVTSPREAAARFASQRGIRLIDAGATTINDLPAYLLIAKLTDRGYRFTLARAFIQLDGMVFDFVGIASASRFPSYKRVFLRTIRGFRREHDPVLLGVKPVRLQIVNAERTAPFRAFLPDALPGPFDAEEVAILNQTELDAPVKRGQLIKLPMVW